jgi:hypothetical protein
LPAPDPLAEPARVAFAGDWHANSRWAVYAIEHAASERADVIVHLGDYGYLFEPGYVRTVEQACAEHRLPLLFVDGNHECFPTLHAFPMRENGLREVSDHVWHLPRGFRWQWAGRTWLALGGAHSVDRLYRHVGESWWPEETITDEQARKVIADGPADVLISHDCPAGVTIPGIDDRDTPPPFPATEIARSDEHRQLLRSVAEVVQPAAVWHGHYHRQYATTADLGYGPVQVDGLDCDGTALDKNVAVVWADEVVAG